MILKKEKNHVINVANTIMFYKTLVSSNLVKQATQIRNRNFVGDGLIIDIDNKHSNYQNKTKYRAMKYDFEIDYL